MRRFREAMDFFYRKHFRTSFLFDAFMKVGAYFFSVFKKNQNEQQRKVFSYALVSDDEALIQGLQSALAKPVQSVPYAVDRIPPQVQLIFDANQLSFSAIISKMEALRKYGPTFKIAHKKEGFLIGSNSSNDRGEVIPLPLVDNPRPII